MKKILFLIGILASMLFTTTAFAIQGEGTEDSPFLITNQEELMLVSDFRDCHFKLMNDIVLEGEFVPLCGSPGSFVGEFKGVFDGNGKTISNLTINQSKDNAGLFKRNSGIIKNLKVETSDEGVKTSFFNSPYAGVIAGINNGIISYVSVKGKVTSDVSDSNNWDSYAGGIVGWNNGTISCVSVEGSISSTNSSNYSSYSMAGGIAGGNSGTISYALVKGDISSTNSLASSYSEAGGIAGGYREDEYTGVITDSYFIGSLSSSGSTLGNSWGGKVTNCYVVATFSSKIATSIGWKVENSFYDRTVSGLSDTGYGTPKTTMAMKMKKTYTDAGWDFENVWGIDENINDGYPYLLWEYAENGSADAEIIGVTATDNSLKFISEVATEGEAEIATFGTTFIPLWLFETGSADVATVEYDNAEHNIQNNQTFGATLGGIPESCKDMAIVGKSFIKNANGIYTWSAAKSASVNDTTLVELK